MRFIDVTRAPELPIAWVTLEATRRTGMLAIESNKRREYVKNNQGWSLLKDWLSGLSGGKCWYCEAKSLRAVLDVDHFRPKLAVTVDGVSVKGHDGYWWLAYEWKNYRLSCQRCNRPITDHSGGPSGKRNEFPLRDESKRARDAEHSIELEEPRLLDPCIEADTALLEHWVDGEVRPRADQPEWGRERARYTIIQLGLSDPQLAEEKRKRWQLLSEILKFVDKGISREMVVDHLKRELEPNAEFSSFFRSAISTHRDKEWIESLL